MASYVPPPSEKVGGHVRVPHQIAPMYRVVVYAFEDSKVGVCIKRLYYKLYSCWGYAVILLVVYHYFSCEFFSILY